MHVLDAALELGRQSRQSFGDEIAFTLRMAKKRRWNKIEEKRIQQEIELQTYINTLIEEDRERYILCLLCFTIRHLDTHVINFLLIVYL